MTDHKDKEKDSRKILWSDETKQLFGGEEVNTVAAVKLEGMYNYDHLVRFQKAHDKFKCV